MQPSVSNAWWMSSRPSSRTRRRRSGCNRDGVRSATQGCFPRPLAGSVLRLARIGLMPSRRKGRRCGWESHARSPCTHGGATSRPTGLAPYRWNGFPEGEQLLHVVYVRRGHLGRDRRVLPPHFSAICGVAARYYFRARHAWRPRRSRLATGGSHRPGAGGPATRHGHWPTLPVAAGPGNVATRSSLPPASSFTSRGLVHFSTDRLDLPDTRCPKTWTRPPWRQGKSSIGLGAVTPQSGSSGRRSQGMPVWSTNRMPLSARRLSSACGQDSVCAASSAEAATARSISTPHCPKPVLP